ncbi:Transcription initiation factor IIF, beta subunit [Kalmanozyma brasiliensis GHG001]|uniref:Transcription initiation factor IIF subunit beta n=1 Tax=Kalmanozyma brasiliensis (strain GHG001) TaxID=1365824 RepID=V5GH40_KALBG|nr:Transcription initiation factor IIF, beta subunit [Kalmanozyma brasiliensis GHG001]EST05332.1 Transcription initiation factor IIF, beta subunit [Kalmanozyma brasiliensis GHG001]
MASYEDDIEPIADPGEGSSSTSLGKRARNNDDAPAASASDAYSRLSPEPDEDMDMTKGKHPVWLVKIPKFLLQAWSAIRTDDLRLGTVRVYDPDHLGQQRMELLLPDPPLPAIPTEPGNPRNPRYDTIPRAYDLKLTSESAATLARNTYAFREQLQDLDPSSSSLKDDDESDEDESGRQKKRGKTRRVTALCGTVTNEAALQPQIRSGGEDVKPGSSTSGIAGGAPISDSYRELLRRRRAEASTPKRTIKMLDSSDAGRHNMMVAGVGSLSSQKSRFNAAIAQKPTSSASGGGEKFARMPKNELLDMLFGLFERWQYWSLKKLRTETQQPESYLREVLTGIADLHKRGPYVGNWSLKPEYMDARKEQEKREQSEKEQQKKKAAEQQEDEEDYGENDESDDDGEDFDDV